MKRFAAPAVAAGISTIVAIFSTILIQNLTQQHVAAWAQDCDLQRGLASYDSCIQQLQAYTQNIHQQVLIGLIFLWVGLVGIAISFYYLYPRIKKPSREVTRVAVGGLVVCIILYWLGTGVFHGYLVFVLTACSLLIFLLCDVLLAAAMKEESTEEEDMREKVLAHLKDKYKALAVFAMVLAIVVSVFIISFHRFNAAQIISQDSSCQGPQASAYDFCQPAYWDRANAHITTAALIGVLMLVVGLGLLWLYSRRSLSRSSIRHPVLALSIWFFVAAAFFLVYQIIGVGWVVDYGFIGFLPLVTASFATFIGVGIFVAVPKVQQEAPEPLADPTEEEEEQYEQALQAVQLNPQSFEAWADLGYIQLKHGLDDDALESANKALALNKRYARAWMVRGAALSTMDDQEDKALQALNRALEQDQNNVDALYYKGRVYMFQEKDKLAHEMFDSVLALNPRHKEALISKGTLYLASDNLDEDHFNGALATASDLIQLYPEDAVGWRMQGTTYQFHGEQKGVDRETAYDLLGKALASFNKALEIDPTDGSTYLMKAGPYVVIRDYGKALEALNDGLKIDPTNTQLQEAKADILGKRRKETASKVAGTAGRMALGGGLGLAKGSGRVGKMFWDVFKDDMKKP